MNPDTNTTGPSSSPQRENGVSVIRPGLEERILFCSDDLAAVNKLAGEAMEGAGRGTIDLKALLAERPGMAGAFPPEAVHRLDVPVTGCALFARNRTALVFLGRAFAGCGEGEARVEKRYWAVIEKPKTGQLAETGELIHWIEADPRRNKSRAHALQDERNSSSFPRGGKGVLHYRIQGEGINYLFMEIDLLTGKHHQIRAQLEAEGLHIKGDLKYGAARSEKNGGIRLHARSLAFPDPSHPENIIRITALPPLMDRLWKDFADCSGI
jgi:23S rRNA pseudouridine1911/1915/1917 synthase